MDGKLILAILDLLVDTVDALAPLRDPKRRVWLTQTHYDMYIEPGGYFNVLAQPERSYHGFDDNITLDLTSPRRKHPISIIYFINNHRLDEVEIYSMDGGSFDYSAFFGDDLKLLPDVVCEESSTIQSDLN